MLVGTMVSNKNSKPL